jgi:hypothetical protein
MTQDISQEVTEDPRLLRASASVQAQALPGLVTIFRNSKPSQTHRIIPQRSNQDTVAAISPTT